MFRICVLVCILFSINCASYKILAVFPFNGKSHHIYYSSLVEELASRNHNVTVIMANNLPKKSPNLYQISLQNSNNESDTVNIEDRLKSLPRSKLLADFFMAYDLAKAFQYSISSNCESLVTNKEVQKVVNDGKFDLVIVEQFVTDCGFALAHRLNAPTVGMTAHILMPWTYSRLGAPNNPSFVPNHFFATGTKPHLFNRIKSVIINAFFNTYYKYSIQRSDNEIVKRVYPGTPDLESLAKNMSLILLNQYFPLSGSRLHGANIVEVGGMHIKDTDNLGDEELAKFLNSAKNGVIYVSFGSVATNFPRTVLDEIIKVMRKSNIKFIWKVDTLSSQDVPKNTLIRRWLRQPAVLCHPKVKVFITHSGMLSSAEAMHCGKPVVSIPLFGDQFANAQSAVENGLGVTVNIENLNEKVLEDAIRTVLQDRYQERARQLSKLWRDRPMSPMDTAVYWIEYVARHGRSVDLKPPTVDLPLYQYVLADVFLIFGLLAMLILYIPMKIFALIIGLFTKKQVTVSKKDKKKKNQ